jgi:hypothetical protein
VQACVTCICRWCVGSCHFELNNLDLRSLVAMCVQHARELVVKSLSSTMEHAAKQVLAHLLPGKCQKVYASTLVIPGLR